MNNLTNRSFDLKDLHYVSKKVEAKYKRTKLRGGEILLSLVGTLGEVFMVPENLVGLNVVRALAVIPVIHNYSPIWVEYYLKSPKIQERLKQIATTSVQATINLKELREIEISFPEKKERESITSILSALDDKIENNLAMNKTLEEMAMALYKHWFIDFGPFREGKFIDSELGKIPEGWEVKAFKDLVQHTVGGDWGKEIQDEQHTIKATVIRGTDFFGAKTGSFSKIPIRFIKESKYKSRKLLDGDIIIEISGGTSDRPTGRTLLVNDNLIKNLGGNVIPTSFCRLIRSINRECSFALGLHIKYIYIKGKTWVYQNQSTGLSNFQYSYFAKEEKIPVPADLSIYKKFNSLITPLFELKHNNEIKVLTKLRDTLLPKLISGEVCLKDVEKLVSEAL